MLEKTDEKVGKKYSEGMEVRSRGRGGGSCKKERYKPNENKNGSRAE